MGWIDNLPAGVRAALSDAGRIGWGRFAGPDPVWDPDVCIANEHEDPEPAVGCMIRGLYSGKPLCGFHLEVADLFMEVA